MNLAALALVTGVMCAAGVATTVWLRTGAYRRPDETTPLPRHTWVAVLTPAAGALLVFLRGDLPWPALVPYLLLVPAGAALAAIDADVRRLPDAITLPLIPIGWSLLVVATIATDSWPSMTRSLLALLIVGSLFTAAALLRAVGLGDAKLMLTLAPCLGWLGWDHLLLGLWSGFTLAALVAATALVTKRATRKTQMAFGPYLIAGTLVALAAAPSSPGGGEHASHPRSPRGPQHLCPSARARGEAEQHPTSTDFITPNEIDERVTTMRCEQRP